MDVTALVARRGGVASTTELLTLGCTERQFRSAVASGALLRVRKGWLAEPTASPDRIAAVRSGARLTCVSATTHFGLWTPPSTGLHLGFPAHGHRLSADAIGHWGSPTWAEHRSVVDPLDTVLQNVLRCCAYEYAVAVVDSALSRELLSLRDVKRLARTSARFAALPNDVDPQSGSGAESVFRVRGRRCGWPLKSQVRIDGLGRVDFLLGDRVLVEIDSRTWHDDKYQSDHTRDLVALRRGYLPSRPTYEHVMHEWQWLERVIDGVMRRGEHQWRPQHRRDPTCDGYSGETPVA